MDTYEQDLSKKLEAARKRLGEGRQIKALKASAPALFEIIDGEISLVLNKTFGEKPLPYDEYVSAHGEMKGMKRIRDLMNSKEVGEELASQEVSAIQDNLKQIQDDKKSK